jgi:hypothetical protein
MHVNFLWRCIRPIITYTHTEYLHVHTVERAHTLENAHTQLEWSYSPPVGIRTGKPASVQTSTRTHAHVPNWGK